MKFVRVEEIPKALYNSPRKDVADILENFLASDMKHAKVVLDNGDYARPEYARQSLVLACKRFGYPIDVKTRNGDIYISKKEV